MPSTIRLHSGETIDVALDPPQLQSELQAAAVFVPLDTPGGSKVFVKPDSVELFQEKETSGTASS